MPTQASSVHVGGPSDLQPQTAEADLPVLSPLLLAGQRPTVNLQHVHSCHSGAGATWWVRATMLSWKKPPGGHCLPLSLLPAAK